MNRRNLLQKVLSVLSDKLAEDFMSWQVSQGFDNWDSLSFAIDELLFHGEVPVDARYSLLTNLEYLLTYSLRKKGLEAVPAWSDEESLDVNYKVLDMLWLKPEQGHLSKLLGSQKSDLAEKRGFYKTDEERKELRIKKLQDAVSAGKIVILLGRHTNKYIKLQKALDKQYKGRLYFISDHVWSKYGFTERGMKVSNSKLSIIQACETARRLPDLGLQGNNIKNRFIMFSLDDYDLPTAISAIYSDPNTIARSRPRPRIDGLNSLRFSYTGLTDLELANIVRNKDWFDLTVFCRTGNQGDIEVLSKEQVSREYGIKLITARIKKHALTQV